MHTHPPPGREQERQQQQQELNGGGGDDAAAALGSGDSALEEGVEKDLLDMDDWDAVPTSATSTSGGSPLGQHQQQQPGYAPQHLHAVYGQPVGGYPPQQQQQGYPPQQQQQAAGYGNAMVPVGGAAPQAYGGATPGWLQEQQPAYGAPASPQRQYQEY